MLSRSFELTNCHLALKYIQDLMHPSLTKERTKHKKKRLVQSPNSYFMDVKCVGKDCTMPFIALKLMMLKSDWLYLDFFTPTGCYRITTIFSHAQTVVPCTGCSLVLCQPRGGKCRLTEGERKFDKTAILIKKKKTQNS